jgi:hypothetical protein
VSFISLSAEKVYTAATVPPLRDGKAVNRNKPEDLPDKVLIATLSGERLAEYIRLSHYSPLVIHAMVNFFNGWTKRKKYKGPVNSMPSGTCSSA